MQKRPAANEGSGVCEPGPARKRPAAKVRFGVSQPQDSQRSNTDLHDHADPAGVSRSAASQHGASEPTVRTAQKRSAQSPRGKLWDRAKRKVQQTQSEADASGHAFCGPSFSTGVSELSASSSGAFEPELSQLYDEAVKSATEGDVEFLMRLHALGHYPRESRSSPKDGQKLAMQARDRQRSNKCNVHIKP